VLLSLGLTARLAAWGAADVRGVLAEGEREDFVSAPDFLELVVLDAGGAPARAPGALGLLERLRATGATSVWPASVDERGGEGPPARVRAAFGGGLGFVVAAATPAGTVGWRLAEQLLRDPGEPPLTPRRGLRGRLRSAGAQPAGGPIWRHTWHEQPPIELPPYPAPDLARLEAGLRDALGSARDLAAAHRLTGWTDVFDRALAVVDALTPHGRALPAAFPAAAQRLYDAAAAGWVFGGMGSWNDLGFENPSVQADYEHVSELLYTAVTRAALGAGGALA